MSVITVGLHQPYQCQETGVCWNEMSIILAEMSKLVQMAHCQSESGLTSPPQPTLRGRMDGRWAGRKTARRKETITVVSCWSEALWESVFSFAGCSALLRWAFECVLSAPSLPTLKHSNHSQTGRQEKDEFSGFDSTELTRSDRFPPWWRCRKRV